MKNYFVSTNTDGTMTVLCLSNEFNSQYFRRQQANVVLYNKRGLDYPAVILAEVTDSPGAALQTIFTDVNPEQNDYSEDRITRPNAGGLLDRLFTAAEKMSSCSDQIENEKPFYPGPVMKMRQG